MLTPSRHINLALPQSWNACSLPQLRAIAAVLADCSLRSDLLHPFDMLEVKVGVFFRLTGIEILSPLNPRVPVEEQYYTCRLRPYTLADESRPLFSMLRYFRSLRAWLSRTILGRDDTFSLYLYQLHYWLTPHTEGSRTVPGLLDWLAADSRSSLLRFPFPELHRHRARRFSVGKPFSKSVTFQGPNPFMDGFSWRRFRFAQDYMQLYADTSNHLIQLRRLGRKAAPSDLQKALSNLDLAKAMFLATVCNRRITFIDSQTGMARTDFRYESNQHSDNAPYFRSFSDSDWQLVMLWWQGMMHWLHKTYPKVFKTQSIKQPKRRVNPLELYTRTTATLEKYLHATAADIDREPYTNILQQLEDITRRNEETEAMNRRLKNRRK